MASTAQKTEEGSLPAAHRSSGWRLRSILVLLGFLSPLLTLVAIEIGRTLLSVAEANRLTATTFFLTLATFGATVLFVVTYRGKRRQR